MLAVVLLLQAGWTDASKSLTAVAGQVKEIHQCSCLNVTWRRAHKDELQRAVTSWAAHHTHVTSILCPSSSREPLLVARCAKSCAETSFAPKSPSSSLREVMACRKISGAERKATETSINGTLSTNMAQMQQSLKNSKDGVSTEQGQNVSCQQQVHSPVGTKTMLLISFTPLKTIWF